MSKKIKNKKLDDILNQGVDVELEGQTFKIAVKFDSAGNQDTLLLFLHGVGLNKDSFESFWFQKYKSDVTPNQQAMAVDLPGHGETLYKVGGGGYQKEVTDPKYLDLEYQAKLLYKMLERVYDLQKEFGQPGFEFINIVGHSMGGSIGVYLGKLITENKRFKLGKFINIEGNLIPPDCGFTKKIHEYLGGRDIKTLDTSSFYGGVLSNFYNDEHLNVIRGWQDYVKDSSANVSAMNYIACSESLWKLSHLEKNLTQQDNGQLLQTLLKVKEQSRNTKFYYLHGSHQPMNDLIKARPWLKFIKTRLIKDAGHLVMATQPTPFYDELKDILGYGVKIKNK